MVLLYIIVLGLLLMNGHFGEAAAFAIPSATTMQPQTSGVQTTPSLSFLSGTPVDAMVVPPLSSLPPVSRITSPPSPHHLELRQRCWNDQGFSVNCAVWTGYRYSWGPASDPYNYWSGNGGSGGGGLVSGDARKAQTQCGYKAVVVFLLVVISLFCTISRF